METEACVTIVDGVLANQKERLKKKRFNAKEISTIVHKLQHNYSCSYSFMHILESVLLYILYIN